jgi:malonyl CoA-acyl carrier protein transacylase
VADFQEINLVIRTITRARRLFTYNAPRAVIVRGTAEQIALADWLFNELSQPANPQNTGPHEYRLATASDEVVGVFLTDAQTPQRLQEISMQIRSVAKDPNTMPYNAPRAIVVRGTTAQIARAGLVIKEQDR